MQVFVGTLELVGLAPPGTLDVSAFLNRGADGLVGGGEEGVFTPMFFTLARKPFGKPGHPIEAAKEVVQELKGKLNN